MCYFCRATAVRPDRAARRETGPARRHCSGPNTLILAARGESQAAAVETTTAIAMEQTEEKEVVEDNGVYLVIENDSPESKDQIKRKSVKILSILHIGSGLLSFSMETVKMGIRSLYQRNEGPDFTTGEGFYCGSIYLLAGLLGLLSLTRTNYCKISAFMILSIFSALFGFVMIVSSLIGSFQTMHQVQIMKETQASIVWFSLL